MRRKVIIALCASILFYAGVAGAQPPCTLIWQAPQQHLAGNPPPSPVNVTGPLNYQLSISCPQGVTPPTQYQIWGGCMDSGGSIPTGYSNVYMNADGTCQSTPLAHGGANGGLQVNATVAGGFVSFNFDLTQYFPQSSIEDINVSSLYDFSTGTYAAMTPRTCPPNNDCDIGVTIGPPAPSATPTPSGAFGFSSPVQGSTVGGTITVTTVNLPNGTQYIKYLLPNAPVNGACAFGQYDNAWNGCSLYTGTNFTYDTTLVPNSTGVQFQALVNGSGPYAITTVTVAN